MIEEVAELDTGGRWVEVIDEEVSIQRGDD